jgi:hypothetical protein
MRHSKKRHKKLAMKRKKARAIIKPRTYQEQFTAALRCETKEQADIWMSDEIQFYLDNYPEVTSPEQAATVIMANIGYYAGYYGPETQQKIYDLFGAVHPIFGTPLNPEPTPEEAFQKGVELGEYMRNAKVSSSLRGLRG